MTTLASAGSARPPASPLLERILQAPLRDRLVGVLAARLGLLLAMLVLVGFFHLREHSTLASFTTLALLVVLAVAVALTGASAALLRVGPRWEAVLAYAPLVFDQCVWTVFVYVTGGAASGATAFYGLTCLVGALVGGLRGASLAGISGALFYSALVFMITWGWLVAPPDQPAPLYHLPPNELAFHTLVTYLVLAVVTLLSGYLAERLRHAGGRVEAAEARAEHAERMAALGRLSAGLAHEIRNPLGAIAGSAELLRTAPGLTDEDRQLCGIIQRETARLEDLVSDMMDLARPRPPQWCAVDPAALACEVVRLASRSGRGVEDVKVEYSGVAPGALSVQGDPAQLRQLVWNLVRNAVQASRPGDTVRVSVEPQGERVALQVSDDGPGIDDATRGRIFDAFFTTRSHGTGIGLAVVKRIADEHGFAIEVESAQGRGAVFRILAPLEGVTA